LSDAKDLGDINTQLPTMGTTITRGIGKICGF